MSSTTYDIVFSGHLLDGVDQQAARHKLQMQFKLSDAAAARLFSGQRILIKRGVDLPTASRYRELFNHAGALAQIVPVEPLIGLDEAARAAPSPQPAPAAGASPGALGLAPPGAPLDELTPAAELKRPETGHLSLMPETGWTLEDCAPPPLPQPLPDIDSLSLEPLPPSAATDSERNDWT